MEVKIALIKVRFSSKDVPGEYELKNSVNFSKVEVNKTELNIKGLEIRYAQREICTCVIFSLDREKIRANTYVNEN